MTLEELWHLDVGEHVLHVLWSDRLLAVTPSAGSLSICTREGTLVAELSGDLMGNGIPSWKNSQLASGGLGGAVRIYEPEISVSPKLTLKPARGIITKTAWNPDCSLLGVAQGPGLHLFREDGSLHSQFAAVGVSDFIWNPSKADEVATVGAGGACMWRVGETEPFSRFEWGGASISSLWSSDGRWLATSDQTPSIHLFDFHRNEPLHIQGYATKVRCLDFSSDASCLATACGDVLTVWTCTGPRGPEGSTPRQPNLHDDEILALAYHPHLPFLASGDAGGRLVLSTKEGKPAAALDADHPISALGWNPQGDLLTVGDAEGFVHTLKFDL